MKNTKEVLPIISAIYCINRTNGNEDKDISNLVEYLLRRCLDGNPNLLALACIKKSKEDIMPEIKQLLKEDTNFYKEC